jgi:hypothetical protein
LIALFSAKVLVNAPGAIDSDVVKMIVERPAALDVHKAQVTACAAGAGR